MAQNVQLKCRTAIASSVMLTNPTTNEKAFIYGYSLGHVPTVIRVLKRVNPAVNKNNAIIVASICNNDGVVKLLLKDQRVNPADQDNLAFIGACEYGAIEVVKLLLNDQRIDPIAQNNKAYELALKNGHNEVVELLIDNIFPQPF